MKQPENLIDITLMKWGATVGVVGPSAYCFIAHARSRQSALKAAKRRLQRLIRDIERLEAQE